MLRARMCLLPLFAAGIVGCQSGLHDDNKALRNQNIELQESLRKKDSELAARPDSSELSALQGQLAERDKQISDLQTKLNAPPAANEAKDDTTPGFGPGITVTRDDKGNITVAVPGDVLFASGDAAVKSGAKTTLDRIAGIIKKDFAGKKVFVDGHTDSDPIVKTKDKWKDNLDLSASRARSVAEYLTGPGGLPKSQVGTRAFAETSPKSSKDKSRRVEIVVATK